MENIILNKDNVLPCMLTMAISKRKGSDAEHIEVELNRSEAKCSLWHKRVKCTPLLSSARGEQRAAISMSKLKCSLTQQRSRVLRLTGRVSIERISN